MRNNIISCIGGIFLLLSCSQKSVTSVAETKVDLEIIEKHITSLLEKEANGWRNNDFQPYYDLAAKNAISISSDGKRVDGKEDIINHFDSMMSDTNVQLFSWKVNRFSGSEHLVVAYSEYTARFSPIAALFNKISVGGSSSVSITFIPISIESLIIF